MKFNRDQCKIQMHRFGWWEYLGWHGNSIREKDFSIVFDHKLTMYESVVLDDCKNRLIRFFCSINRTMVSKSPEVELWQWTRLPRGQVVSCSGSLHEEAGPELI